MKISLHWGKINGKWVARSFYEIASINERIVVSSEPLSKLHNFIHKESLYWNLVTDDSKEISAVSLPALSNEIIHYFLPDRLSLWCKSNFQEETKNLDLKLIRNKEDSQLLGGIYQVKIPRDQNIIEYIEFIKEHSKNIYKISALTIHPHFDLNKAWG